MPHDPLTLAADGSLDLAGLSKASGVSVQTLRAYLRRSMNPLPCYQVGRGKIRVQWEQWLAWMEGNRRQPPTQEDFRDFLGASLARHRAGRGTNKPGDSSGSRKRKSLGAGMGSSCVGVADRPGHGHGAGG